MIALNGVSTRVKFIGGTMNGLVRELWATREISIYIQSPALLDRAKTLTPSKVKPKRQIYELVWSDGREATYRLQHSEIAS